MLARLNRERLGRTRVATVLASSESEEFVQIQERKPLHPIWHRRARIGAVLLAALFVVVVAGCHLVQEVPPTHGSAELDVSANVTDRSGVGYTGPLRLTIRHDTEDVVEEVPVGAEHRTTVDTFVVAGALEVSTYIEGLADGDWVRVDVVQSEGAPGRSHGVSVDPAREAGFSVRERARLRSGRLVLALGDETLAPPPVIATVVIEAITPPTNVELIVSPGIVARDVQRTRGVRLHANSGDVVALHSWNGADRWTVRGVFDGVHGDDLVFALGATVDVLRPRFADVHGAVDLAKFEGACHVVFHEASTYSAFVATRPVGYARFQEAWPRIRDGVVTSVDQVTGEYAQEVLAPETAYVVELWSTAALENGVPLAVANATTGAEDSSLELNFD